jgi:C4-dicarboxylate transporter DctM subunit
MSAVVVFIIFAICLVIAIPISISLGIVAVLPGAFDASFTASAGYVIRSMVGGIDSFPLLAVPMFVLAGILMAHGKISEKLFDVFVSDPAVSKNLSKNEIKALIPFIPL